MRVLCAYTELHPATKAALDRFAPEAEFFDVSKSDSGYFDLLADAWRRQESFLNIEHDIEIREGVIESAKRCKQPWCVWPYEGHSHEELTGALGCTKFGARLMRLHPTLMDEAGDIQNDCAIPRRYWARHDARLLATLRAHGLRQPHLHESVEHHLYGV